MGSLARASLAAGLIALCAMALPAVATATEGIKGTVTNAEMGQLIEGAEVCLFESTSEGQIACDKTKANGDYEIIGPPAGFYKVRFEKSGFTTQWYSDQPTWSSAQSVQIVAGKVTENIDAKLATSGVGTINGHVTGSANGQGVGGIRVCADSSEGHGIFCNETNGNGEYAISDLSTGTYDVGFSPQYNSCEEELGVKVRCVLNANVIGQSVKEVHVKAGPPQEVNVTLQAGGQITGTVTNASITRPAVAKIEVSATLVNGKGEPECGGEFEFFCARYSVWTNSSGAYTISGLPSGSYKVSFGGNICTEVTRGERKEQECVIAYVGDFYHDKASFEKAEAVNATAGQATGGINESLYEAFPATPASTAAPTLTGTPAVGQALTCSQGSWSHEPTYVLYQWLRNGTVISGQTGSTYTLAAADQGHSIACSVTAGNGADAASAMSNAVAIPVPLAVFAGVKVRGSVASVTLSCPGPGACSGVMRIVARVTTRHGRRRKTSNVTIGVASFSMLAGKRVTLRVHLTGPGTSLLRRAGRSGLRVQITGPGIQTHAAMLRSVKKRR